MGIFYFVTGRTRSIKAFTFKCVYLYEDMEYTSEVGISKVHYTVPVRLFPRIEVCQQYCTVGTRVEIKGWHYIGTMSHFLKEVTLWGFSVMRPIILERAGLR